MYKGNRGINEAMSEIKGPQILGVQVFKMVRPKDETGVSGTGHILDGIVFPNGKCVVCWKGASPAVTVWDSFDAFKRIHVDAHPNNETKFEWMIVTEIKENK